ASTATLKAIAFETGMTDSPVTLGTYTIGSGGGGTTLNFEAENLSDTGSGATTSVQTDVNSSGGKWVELAGNSGGDHIASAGPTVPAGPYQLEMEGKGLARRRIPHRPGSGTARAAARDQY